MEKADGLSHHAKIAEFDIAMAFSNMRYSAGALEGRAPAEFIRLADRVGKMLATCREEVNLLIVSLDYYEKGVKEREKK